VTQDKARVASAANDTTREVGAAIGIALLGSLMSSGYRSSVGDSFDALPAAAAEAARDSVGAALHVAQQAPESLRSGLVLTGWNRLRRGLLAGHDGGRRPAGDHCSRGISLVPEGLTGTRPAAILPG
jgi:hypothetical protein